MIDFDFGDDAESVIEKEAVKYAKKRGWFVVKLMRCDINSMPDRLFHRKGFTMYIEFKAPGKPADSQQALRHQQIRGHGIPVHVIDDLGEARVLLR